MYPDDDDFEPELQETKQAKTDKWEGEDEEDVKVREKCGAKSHSFIPVTIFCEKLKFCDWSNV